MHKLYIIIALFCFQQINAQELRSPLDIPLLLSGNFGELRSNHFHSGLDFKTQGVVGKPVYAVSDGYVSRILVSPWGFGYALYLDHPNGTTTVYGHLDSFSPTIEKYVKAKHYELESYNLNVFPKPDEIPVKKGDMIARSGNRGSSGGPHLHFELRGTKTEETLDALPYYKGRIDDTRPPKILGILVCPIEGKGVVNGSNRRLELKPVTNKDGKQSFAAKIEAWGEIGLAIKANDYMDNTSNVYGVKDIELRLDDQIIYQSNLDRFDFDETRYINSMVDYELLKKQRNSYQRSYIEPGNKLRFIKRVNRGIIDIDKPQNYMLTYKVTDAFGNSSKVTIRIEGKKQPIPKADTNGKLFHWNRENRFESKEIRLNIAKGNLYDDFYFLYSVKEDEKALANTHIVHENTVPIHKSAQLSLRIKKDTLDKKHQYGIVRVQNGNSSWIGGTYRNGWMDADIREFGNYTVSQDTKVPVIAPINPKTWIGKQAFVFRLSDNLSGIDTYRGEIDGKYILFEMNNRSVITYKFDKERLKRGKHTLRLVVKDMAGNEALYTYPFNW